MIDKPLNEITREDLQWLVDNQVPEDMTTEYKSELNFSNDDRKKKLLEEVTAFANTDGGDLIFGIREENKVAVEVVGVVKVSEYDKTIQMITNFMAVKVRPRINAIEFGKVDLGNDDLAIVIRVRSSIFSPHAVYDGVKHSFHIRKANSIFHMDVDEMRNSFLKAENFSRKIREFIADRLAEINSNRYGYLNKEYPILVVHTIPVNHFLKNDIFPVKDIDSAVKKSGSKALHTTYNRRITFDGVRLASILHKDKSQAYAFYYLNGTIEIAGQSGFFSIQKEDGYIPAGTKLVKSALLCNMLFECFDEIHQYYKTLGIDDPILFYISILNARGYHVYYGHHGDYNSMDSAIDRDVVTLPELYFDKFSRLENDEIPRMMQPLFDSIWNASGLEKCFFYDDSGNFKIPDNFW